MNVLDICKRILTKNQLDHIQLNLTNEERYNMCFDIINHEININEKSLKNEALDYQMSFEDFVSIIFYHELGHFLDKEIDDIHKSTNDYYEILKLDPFNNIDVLSNIKNNSIKAEENAWLIAEKFVDDDIRENFMLVKKNSLEKAKEIEELVEKSMIGKIELEIAKVKVEELKKQLGQTK
ncbi:hypothetical protein MPH47_04205 [Psychrobacillus psychrodurans]|uniref:hypothetical protein n=1 Tax=Psychrobacillus psychrodurans TaxID=126157 RepID=UPI001F4ECB4C|nr:hypothetical protein [Psychrobacillus psychrodurans]MCK1996448.1 hypothetical protein [Psychrobacillus psychrodurans]